MNTVKLDSMIMNHELMKAMGTDQGVGSLYKMKCRMTGRPFSYLELAQGEALTQLFTTDEDDRAFNVLVIHDTDLDGTVASLLLERYLLALNCVTVNKLPRTSGKPFRDITTEDVKGAFDVVFVLDHAFNADVYKLLQKTYAKLVWVDHHPVVGGSEIDVNTEAELFYIDQSYSTAMLVYSMTTCSELVEYSEAVQFSLNTLAYLTHFYDTWQFLKEIENVSETKHQFLANDARGLSTWFYTYPDSVDQLKKFFQSTNDESLLLGQLFDFVNQGVVVDKIRKMTRTTIMSKYVNKVNWTLDDKTYRVSYVFHSDDMSNLGHDILTEGQGEVDAVAVIFVVGGKGIARFSLRGLEEGPAVNLICQRLGGGGHRNAAGFEIPVAELSNYLKDITLPLEGEQK